MFHSATEPDNSLGSATESLRSGVILPLSWGISESGYAERGLRQRRLASSHLLKREIAHHTESSPCDKRSHEHKSVRGRLFRTRGTGIRSDKPIRARRCLISGLSWSFSVGGL